MLALRKFIHPNVTRLFFRPISSSGSLYSEELNVHRDTPDNNPKVPFEFTAANKERIKALLLNYPVGAERSVLGAALDLVQRQVGWLPISGMHEVAKMLHIPRVRVYEWATFYTMNKRRYRGKFHLKVCKTTPCMLRGSDAILKAVEDHACCAVGELSPDCLFGVDTVECQGACANAPVLVVDDDYYEDVTICDVIKIIEALKCGTIPPAGPQNGRFAAEPMCGPTSLLSCPPGPGYGLQETLKSNE